MVKADPDRVIDLYNTGEYEKVLVYLNDKEDFLKEPTLTFVLGATYFRLKQYEQALKMFLNSKSVMTKTVKTRHSVSKDDFEPTLIPYQLNHNIGVCYIELGHYERAKDHFMKLLPEDIKLDDVKLNDKKILSKTYNEFGYSLGMLGEHSEAKIKIEKSIELDPDNSNARKNLLFVVFKESWKHKIVEKYKDMLKEDISAIDFKNPKGKSIEDEIKNCTETFIINFDHTWAQLKNALNEIFEDVQAVYEPIIDKFPNNNYIKNTYGYILNYLGKYVEGSEVCSSVIRENPSIKGAYRGKFYSYVRINSAPISTGQEEKIKEIRKQRLEDILDIIESGLRLDNDDSDSWLYKGYLHLKMGMRPLLSAEKMVNIDDMKIAKSCFQYAVNLEKDKIDPVSLNQLGIANTYLEDYNVAGLQFDRVNELQESYPFPYFNKAFIDVIACENNTLDLNSRLTSSINNLNIAIYHLIKNWFRDKDIFLTNLFAVLFFKAYCHGKLNTINDYEISLKYLELSKNVLLKAIESIKHDESYKDNYYGYLASLNRNLGFVNAKLSKYETRPAIAEKYLNEATLRYTDLLNFERTSNDINQKAYFLNSYGYFYLYFKNKYDDGPIYSLNDEDLNIDQIFKEAINNTSDYPLPSYNLGYVYYKRAVDIYIKNWKDAHKNGDFKTNLQLADTYFSKAIEIDSTMMRALLHKSLIYVAKKEFHLAYQYISRCRDLKDNYDSFEDKEEHKILVDVLTGSILTSLGRYGEAVELLKDLQPRFESEDITESNFHLIYLHNSSLSNAWIGLQDYDEAIKIYKRLIEKIEAFKSNNEYDLKIPKLEYAYLYLGMAQYHSGDFLEPPESFTKISDNSYRGLKYLYTGLCYYHRNDIEDAIVNFEEASQRTTDKKLKAIALYNKGVCHVKQNDSERAYKRMEEACKSDSDFYEAKVAMEKLKGKTYPDLVSILFGSFYVKSHKESKKNRRKKKDSKILDKANIRFSMGKALFLLLITTVIAIIAFPIENMFFKSFTPDLIISFVTSLTIIAVMLSLILIIPWVKKIHTLGIELETASPRLDPRIDSIMLPLLSLSSMRMPITFSLMSFRLPIQQPILLLSEFQDKNSIKGTTMPNRYPDNEPLLDNF